MNGTSAPANWYADPSGRFELRYWDGAAWTDHVASGGRQEVSPLAPPPPLPTTEVAVTSPTHLVAEHQISGSDKKPGLFARIRNERRAKLERRGEFEALAMRAATGDPEAFAALPTALMEARPLWKSGEFDAKAWEVMAAAVRNVIADDVVTEEEESHLRRLGDVLGTPMQGLATNNFALFEELAIAEINDGRFPVLADPPIMVRKGEKVYASFNADLMKEVVIREFRGGSSGISVPLGGGVRYRVGGMRGRSVVVGSELVAQDSGLLVVTSTRSVFVGQKKTLEFRNDKLVGLEQFADGLRLNVSNRQTASLFTFPPGQSPSIAAALISASSSQG